ncbi:hypothetical protein BCR33DRAFT_563766 [Rhizoclosmatium globosum]|uniref:Uncharacterized protein n=1 Tax=Rhizoclosmatium globosum TaxID=329046 RepID=A0A1Y2B836_9FUNG|nr:hypothetical protein BCR33DRAFT_563766 [Rhizoclosmatium globosum]|eukprot:ORY30973.1 hypothetical protein BCR33DRAFT_563766 [Rhizoclosmatium globosum]
MGGDHSWSKPISPRQGIFSGLMVSTRSKIFLGVYKKVGLLTSRVFLLVQRVWFLPALFLYSQLYTSYILLFIINLVLVYVSGSLWKWPYKLGTLHIHFSSVVNDVLPIPTV